MHSIFIIIGNCQSRIYSNLIPILIPNTEAIPVWLADRSENGKIRALKAKNLIKSRASNIYVLTQHITNNSYGFFTTENIKSVFPESKIITNFYYKGLHPDLMYFRDDSDNNIKSLIGDYHSKIILQSFFEHVPVEECLKRFCYEYYIEVGLNKVKDISSFTLLDREKIVDIKFAEQFLHDSLKRLTLLTFNHPTFSTIHDYVKKIATYYHLTTVVLPETYGFNTLLTDPWWPVYDFVKRDLSITYATYNYFKGKGEFSRSYTLNYFVEHCYKIYNNISNFKKFYNKYLDN